MMGVGSNDVHRNIYANMYLVTKHTLTSRIRGHLVRTWVEEEIECDLQSRICATKVLLTQTHKATHTSFTELLDVYAMNLQLSG